MEWRLKTLYERIIDRWTELEADYTKINRNRSIITAYFRSDELLETDDKGNLLGQDIYNASGPWYSRMMATGFQGSLISKNISWIRYQMEQFELQGIDQLDQWVQDIKDYMADVYQRSNTYDVQPQFTHDGVTTGSPLMFAEENIIKQKTIWKPQHFKNVRLYYDGDNEVEGVIIKDKTWTAKQIFDTFIKEDDDKGTKRNKMLTIEVNRALESGKLNDEFVVYRAVFKAGDPIWDGKGEDAWKKLIANWNWYSVYFLEISQVDNNKRNTPLNDNIGYFSQPFATWNFDKKPWEVSSRTPAFYAIWDCMSLQQIDKNYFENMQLKNRPPFIAPDSMKGRVSLSPEGEMYVDDKEYDRAPKGMDLVSDLELNKDIVEIKVDALKRWFYIDQLQMFTDLVRTNKAPVATIHIWQMVGEKATLLSPAIETHSRYLESLDDRMLNIEWTAGRGPFNRDTLANITDIVLSNAKSPVKSIGVMPVFVGALAQAQKAAHALEPIMSSIGAAKESGLFDLDPDLRYAIRGWETLNDIFEARDFPQKNIVPKDEFAKIKTALAEKRAQDEQLAKALEIAKASKDVSGKVEPDSILGAMAGAAG